MRRTLLLLLLLTAALLLTACGGSESNAATTAAPQEPPPLPADVREVGAAVTATAQPAETGTIVAADNATGTLVSTGEFVSPTRSEVAAKIVGRVARVHVDEGAFVRRGQPLLTMETDYLRLNLQAAEAETSRAQAILSEAQRDLARKQELIAKGSIPQATFDRSQAGFEQARAAHAAAVANASLLRQQIADSTVRSPITGVVAAKNADVGQKLGDGAVPFVIVQIAPIKLRFTVPERYLGRVRPGQSVTAKVDPYPNESFTGRISAVGGVIDPRTRTMFAEAEFPNADMRLRPGLFARVETKF